MGRSRRRPMIILAVMTLALLACAGYGMVYGTGAAEETASLAEAVSGEDAGEWTQIRLGSGGASDGKTVIRRGGAYRISGTLTEGQIYVDAEDSEEVVLCLAGAEITNSSEAAVYIKNAGKTILFLEEGTRNILQSGREEDKDEDRADTEEETDIGKAVVYARDDLQITGSGALEVYGYIHNGIHTTNHLTVDSGEIRVEAVNVGIKGKDSVTVTGGGLTIISEGDGIKSNDTTGEDYGKISISGGTFQIESGGDGIQAETTLDISGGDFTITSGGGSEAAPVTADRGDEGLFGHPGDRGGRGMMPPDGAGDPSMSFESEEEMPPVMSGNGRKEFPVPSEDMEGEPGTARPERGGHRGGMSGEWPKMPEPGMEEIQEETEEDNTPSCKGLKSGAGTKISGGTFTLDACDDAFHSDGAIFVSDGTLYIKSGDDGIHADTELTVTGGTVEIGTCYEGLEANQIRIEDGVIRVTSSDDGINANGGANGWMGRGMGDREDTETAEEEMPNLCISGGTVLVDAGGDGLDSNGNLTIQGGTVIVDGPSDNGNGALDSGSESGGHCVVHGGLVLAIGSSGMAESFDDGSMQASFSCRLSSGFQAGSVITITDREGQVLCTHTAAKEGSSVVFSCPALAEGETVFLEIDGEMQEIEI